MSGYVYFIACHDRIKIGFSFDPIGRLRKIKSDAPYPCEYLGSVPVTTFSETEVHRHFEAYRKHGEWFENRREVRDFVRRHGAQTAESEPDAGVAMLLAWVRDKRGRGVALGALLGVYSSGFTQWRRIPADRVEAISDFTGIPREKLRPDVFRKPGVAA